MTVRLDRIDCHLQWKTREGVRELIQNWYDGVREQAIGITDSNNLASMNTNMPLLAPRRVVISPPQAQVYSGKVVTRFLAAVDNRLVGVLEYSEVESTLRLVNAHVALPRKVLLLGASGKRAAPSMEDAFRKTFVGQFGEGMKVCGDWLVLLLLLTLL